MTYNKYFQDELTFLRDLGREFSSANPKLAPFLADRGNDPDVERLMEGFAFLTGRLRQRLDDELPELTHSVLSLLYPNFLRPVPAGTIISFDPIANAVTTPRRIDAGIDIDSIPVDGTVCRFRTSYPVDLLPLRIARVQSTRVVTGTKLTLTLEALPNVLMAESGLETLRIHFDGDPLIARNLYLWFMRYLDSIRVGGERGFSLGADAVRRVGFDRHEGLFPYPDNTFLGYRLLQEYFSLPEKFLFIDIVGLAPIRERAAGTTLEIDFLFRRALEDPIRARRENFRLYCTPAVNLFPRDADPIRIDQTKTQYRVRPSGKDARHFEIFSIDAVEGYRRAGSKRHVFLPFETFQHGEQREDTRVGYYRRRLVPAVIGHGMETYLSFVDPNEEMVVPEVETVSLELSCTNRDLPEKLKSGDVRTATGTSPEYATFRNLSPPSPSVTPPLERGLQWLLISNLSLNYVSLVEIGALRTILSAYDFRAFYDRTAERETQLRLQGLQDSEVQTVDLLHRGMPVRGIRTKLRVTESNFAGEGDMYVFASVLSQFFAMYASINSFHELIVEGVETGEVYRWQPTVGQQPVL